MAKENVLILGGTGMLGSMVSIFFNKFRGNLEVSATHRIKSGRFKLADELKNINWLYFDVLDFIINEEKYSFIKKYDWIINCIGITKPFSSDNNPEQIENAIKINSLFPYKLSRFAKNTKIIQIATDCVYSGLRGKYSENSKHDALDVYGKTKSLGEVKYGNVMNLRTSIIGPEFGRTYFLLEWFLNQPKQAEVRGFVNHFWNGITTYHFAKITYSLILNKFELVNLQHIVPLNFVSKHELLNLIGKIFNRSDIKIVEFHTEDRIDRTLITDYPDRNKLIWGLSGYNSIPTIDQLLVELKDFIKNNCFNN